MIPTHIVAALGPSHRGLLRQELASIAGHVQAMWQLERLPPSRLAVFLMDLRSAAGAEVAGSILGDGGVRDAVIQAMQQARLPVMCFPLPIEPAVELLRLCLPELLDSFLPRPPDRMPIVIVDALDTAVMIAVDRVPHAGSA